MLLIALISLILNLSPIIVQSGVVEDKYSCPHGWTRYGSKKCLKYVNELQDYERAQATCRSKNQGTLVTVHSHEEQNFVYSYIHSIAASSTPIWLGAKQIDFESILWLDKTENSYTNWAPSEPSHPDEICIAINPRNGMWHDVMCTEANVPACERAPTTQWPFFVAFCSEGWFQFNDEKCVRIISSQALNFYESQELCRSKYNSKLLSIKTDRESEFLHNLIKFRDIKLPVWLGAVQNDFSSFNWIDKTDVTFTNWAEGEPNDPDHACLSMTASGGKWSDNDCKEQKLILCQKAVPEDSSCETGWLQFRQDKCYRFVHIRLAFDDAESLCNNLYGGHLPSIHSQEEQFMISQFLASVNVKNGSEIWLGGRQMDFHNFNWGDGSLFNYSYWEHGEPNFPAEKCIEMSWRNGRWNDINCRLKRAVLCERQVTSRHHIKPNLYQPFQICLESNCTTPSTIGQQGNGQDQSSAPADPSDSVVTNLNSTGINNSPHSELETQTPSNNASSSSFAAPAGGPSTVGEPGIVPFPDDRPFKVITSIMHREHSTAAEPSIVYSVASNATSKTSESNQTNGTSVSHSLPSTTVATNKQPESVVGGKSNKEQSAVDQPIETNQKSAPAMSQQAFDSTLALSLIDKIKPETNTGQQSVSISASTSLLSSAVNSNSTSTTQQPQTTPESTNREATQNTEPKLNPKVSSAVESVSDKANA